MADAPTSPGFMSERRRAVRAVVLGALLGLVLALLGRRRAAASRG
ncbi:MAG: hypothetical protein ACXVWF_05210 [Actinomycetota bacterium]